MSYHNEFAGSILVWWWYACNVWLYAGMVQCMVVCKMTLKVKKKSRKVKPKIRQNEWDKTAEMLRKTAETVLGVTFGKRKGDSGTWWWNEEVLESIKEKKEAKKAWDKIRNENSKKMYKEKKSKAKKAVDDKGTCA